MSLIWLFATGRIYSITVLPVMLVIWARIIPLLRTWRGGDVEGCFESGKVTSYIHSIEWILILPFAPSLPSMYHHHHPLTGSTVSPFSVHPLSLSIPPWHSFPSSTRHHKLPLHHMEYRTRVNSIIFCFVLFLTHSPFTLLTHTTKTQFIFFSVSNKQASVFSS